MLPEFDLVEPATLDEALGCLADPARRGRPLAGGTNLIVDLRSKRANERRLVSLWNVKELTGIQLTKDTVELGARTTVAALAERDTLATEAPILCQAAQAFAGAMVRNAATVAGNICDGSPAADLVPPLMALDAELELRNARGARRLAIKDFYTGYRRTVLKPDELVTAIRWRRADRTAMRFHKLALRRGDAISVVSLAVAVQRANGACADARIAMGAAAPAAKRAVGAESLLKGHALDEEVCAAAAARAAAEAEPIDDLRASADYRRHAVGVLTQRLLMDAWHELA